MRSQKRTMVSTSLLILLMAAILVLPMVSGAQAAGSYPADYAQKVAHYDQHEKPILDIMRTRYTGGSLAEAIGSRAMWYMQYGYTVYGHSLYAQTGYIDCSQFVSRVYADFGYTITGASRKYTTVGTVVSGVYAQKLSTGKYTLVGVDKLRVGDIFTFWAKDSNGDKYISHVAMYIGKPNGIPTIINTVTGHPTAIGFVDNFSYWYGSNLYDVRRVLPANAYYKGGAAINDKGPVIPAVYQMPIGQVILPKDLAKGF
ncbi:MAG: NlpC/P60 family protein [Methylocystaceae bacterium]